jgi:hypothetical protein
MNLRAIHLAHFGIAAAITVLGYCSPAVADPPSTIAQKGMTLADVQQRLGRPGRIDRQILYRRHIEQWVYENPHPILVQFSCVRGEEPVVTAVLPIKGPAQGRFR